MQDSTIVKIVAIVSLVLLEIVNMFTLKLDGNLMLTIGGIIGGIAGYQIGLRKPSEEEEKPKQQQNQQAPQQNQQQQQENKQ
jgi:membrane protein YqaA with SNARE-associated domain